MKQFLLACLLLYTGLATAQNAASWQWASNSGTAVSSPGKSVTDMATDAAGNVYVLGYYYNSTLTIGGFTLPAATGTDIFLAKYNSAGVLLWLKRHAVPTGYNERGETINVDAAGFIYISGTDDTPTLSGKAFLAKYDNSGTMLWNRYYSLYELNSVNLGPDGHLLVQESNQGTKYLRKLDKTDGSIMWTDTIAGAGSNAYTTYQDFTDAAGNVYFTAFSMGNGNTVNVLGDVYTTIGLGSTVIGSVDNNGNKRWTQVIDGIQVQLGFTVDAAGKQYLQLGGGFGGTFQGISTASPLGNRYLELNSAGTLVYYSAQSPYLGLFRVKPDGIYSTYLYQGSGTARSLAFGDYFISVPAATTAAAGVVIKYQPGGAVSWANSFTVTGTAYNSGSLTAIETAPSGAVQVGGSLGTAAAFGNINLSATGSGTYYTDVYTAQFNPAALAPVVTTWTGGAGTTAWTDGANWNNGVPAGFERTIIPAGISQYPQNITTANITGKLEIAPGVSLTLPAGFMAPGGIVNRGSVTVAGTGNFSGFNTGSTPLDTRNGRLVFATGSPSAINLADTIGSLQVNQPGATFTTYSTTLVRDALDLTAGKVYMLAGPLTLLSPAAAFTYSATGYISGGSFKRAVATSGTYVFPVSTTDGRYTPVTVQTNGVAGSGFITATFSSSTSGNTPNAAIGGTTVTSLLNAGVWTLSADAALTTGSYTVTAQANQYSNGVTDPARYVLLRRDNSNVAWTTDGQSLAGTQAGGTVSGSTVANGTVTAGAQNMQLLGDVAIGIAALPVPPGSGTTTTTWTGVNTTWTDAANWTAGVPTAGSVAILPAGLAKYPAGITVSNTVARLVVGSGVSIALPYNYFAPQGVVSDGRIEVNGNGYFGGFGNSTNGYSPLSGNGTLVFTTNGLLGIAADNLAKMINHNVLVDGPVNSSGQLYINGNLTLANGAVINTVTMYNPNAIINTIGYSYVSGTVNTYIRPNGSYRYPFFNGIVEIQTNNLTGPAYFYVSSNNNFAPGTAPNFTYNGEPVNKRLNAGFFRVFTSTAIAGGNYQLTIREKGATNRVPDVSKYLVINRADNTSAWSFTGTAGTPSQAGDTVTAVTNGITATGDFGIGIAGNFLAKWTGASGTDWNTAGNWDLNAVPNLSIQALFDGTATNTPQNFPAAPAAERLTVQAGVAIKLPVDFTSDKGIVNNGAIELLGSGTFTGFANLSGSGKLVFTANSPSTFSAAINNHLEVNKPSANLISQAASVAGNVNVLNGYIQVPLSGSFTMTNPNATITIASAANAVNSRLTRAVNANGTYVFPVTNYGYYDPVTITTHNYASASPNIQVIYAYASYPFNPGILAPDGAPVVSNQNSCYWQLSNGTPTSGTFDLVFEGRNYTTGIDPSRYVLLRKALNSTTWEVVANATVTESNNVLTATATGMPALTTIYEFTIGIKGYITTWTGGAGNGAWTTAGNWDNGVPNANTKAVLVSGSPNYPTGLAAGNAAAALDIAAGVTLRVPQSFTAGNGIVNNGTIEVTGSSGFTQFSNLSGNGRLLFGTASPTFFASGQTLNMDVEINNPSGFNMQAVTLGRSVYLTAGAVSGTVTMSDATATVTGSATGFFTGTLKRTVNASGTYSFPVGAQAGANLYANPLQLQLNNIAGPQNITVSFTRTISGVSPNTTAGGQPVTQLLNSGVWTVTPNTALTGGSYNITLTGSGYTNGVADATRYVVLKRNNTSAAWAFFGNNGTASQTGATVTAAAGNISGFSDFAIGIATNGVGTTLPLQLLYFTATPQRGQVMLQWQVVPDPQLDHFITERSCDGLAWTAMATVPGQPAATVYRYADAAPGCPVLYYRLVQVNRDGSREYSAVVKVKLAAEGTFLRLYPNPASGAAVMVQAGSQVKLPVSYGLYNSGGALVLAGQLIQPQQAISLKGLPAGTYYLRTVDGYEAQLIRP